MVIAVAQAHNGGSGGVTPSGVQKQNPWSDGGDVDKFMQMRRNTAIVKSAIISINGAVAAI